MTQYRCGWISDVHLGTKGCQAEALLEFFRDHDFETLYIVGDLIDIWALRRTIHWPQTHSDVIQKLLRKARKGTKIIYVTGNHDDFLEKFHGVFGGISLRENALHVAGNSRRFLVMHGHELDAVVQNLGWLAHIGDAGYRLLMRCNGLINGVRRLFGCGYWSLSVYVKAEVKNVVGFIGKFEEAIVRYAREYDVDGVICGHIHTASRREIDSIAYFNTGDWVESCTALVEDYDGRMEILQMRPGIEAAGAPLPSSPNRKKAVSGTMQV